MINKIKTNKTYKNVAITFLSIFAFAAYFMVALTFQHIGNGTMNYQLIIGFVFGLLGSITIIAGIVLTFFKPLAKKYDLLLLVGVAVGIALALLAFIFGSIGYEKVV